MAACLTAGWLELERSNSTGSEGLFGPRSNSCRPVGTNFDSGVVATIKCL